MADIAVESLPLPGRALSEDVEMGDDVASLPAESSHDVLSPAPNGAPPLASAAAPAPAQPPRARPKLDLSSFTNPAAASRTGAGERRKGKSIFGVVLGTLNKAKVEDRQRNASEAAKKRQSIDARLQAKLSREQNIVRKQDESRKDRLSAIRKQEDMTVKSSLITWRYESHKAFSNFLLTSDVIPQDVDMNDDETNDKTVSIKEDIILSAKPTFPPPLYYLPKVLTPAQEDFLSRRRKQVAQRVAAESDEWDTEKQNITKEIEALKEASQAAKLEASKVAGTEEESGDPSTATPQPSTPALPPVATPASEVTAAPVEPTATATTTGESVAQGDAMDQDEVVEY